MGLGVDFPASHHRWEVCKPYGPADGMVLTTPGHEVPGPYPWNRKKPVARVMDVRQIMCSGVSRVTSLQPDERPLVPNGQPAHIVEGGP